MNTRLKKSLVVVAISSLFAASTAQATNGYFAHGYGTKNKGLAGGGVALPQDAMIAATNPAGMVWVGSRMDIGAAIFSPLREYNVSNVSAAGAPPAAFPLAPGTVESDSNIFLIPHFARNWMLDSDSSIGVSVYGNGGMNTDYSAAANTFGAGATGVDLSQLFINTTYAKKLDANSSVGVSLITAYQRFKATGLGGFGFFGFSSDPANLTDVGYDDSLGFGLKIGYQIEAKPGLTYAISYQDKMHMSRFKKYAGLFAEQGDFDIPASWTMGFAYDTSSSSTVTLDMQRIMFNKVASIGNPLLPNIGASLLGNDGGAGFGWDNMLVLKLGYQWSTSDDMTWRAGVSHGEQPIASTEVLFNILAPAVMKTHLTGGLTMQMSSDTELNLSAMYAPSADVTGPNPLAPDQNNTLEMSQWELEASWSWKY